MSSLIARIAIGLFVLSTACTSSTSNGDSAQPPKPETLFDTLPAATPTTLRGVWQTIQTQTNGTAEVRLFFTDKYLVGAARCSATGSNTPVIAGGSIGLDTSALDAATGTVTFG